MNVKVRYFATARLLADRRDETMSLPDSVSLTFLKNEILSVHPRMTDLMKAIRFAVNFEIVTDIEILHEGDEVGVLPPVAVG